MNTMDDGRRTKMDGHGRTRTDTDGVEVRSVAAELRAEAQEGAAPKLVGYAAVFGKRSVDMGGFREMIEQGFFDLAVHDDVRALWNHESAFVLGRTRSGTLEVGEDETGLRMSCMPPDTQWARDALETVRRGDVDQMSFGFSVRPGGEEWRQEADGSWLRILKAGGCDRLYEVSPVTFPAYTSTTLEVRSRLDALRAQAAAASDQIGEQEAGQVRTRARATLARRRLDILEREL